MAKIIPEWQSALANRKAVEAKIREKYKANMVGLNERNRVKLEKQIRKEIRRELLKFIVRTSFTDTFLLHLI